MNLKFEKVFCGTSCIRHAFEGYPTLVILSFIQYR